MGCLSLYFVSHAFFVDARFVIRFVSCLVTYIIVWSSALLISSVLADSCVWMFLLLAETQVEVVVVRPNAVGMN